MKKQLIRTLETLLAVVICSLFIALAISLAMLVFPVVLLLVIVLAIREIIIHKRKREVHQTLPAHKSLPQQRTKAGRGAMLSDWLQYLHLLKNRRGMGLGT